MSKGKIDENKVAPKKLSPVMQLLEDAKAARAAKLEAIERRDQALERKEVLQGEKEQAQREKEQAQREKEQAQREAAALLQSAARDAAWVIEERKKIIKVIDREEKNPSYQKAVSAAKAGNAVRGH